MELVVVENLPTNAGDIRDARLIPGSGRSPGEGRGNPLQYSCLENPLDRLTHFKHTVLYSLTNTCSIVTAVVTENIYVYFLHPKFSLILCAQHLTFLPLNPDNS